MNSKYYPPDFDPTKIKQKPKSENKKIRFMVPMDIQCTPCTQTIKKGKIVNGLKEKLTDRNPDFSFCFKCPNCSYSLIIHSDSLNMNYYTYLNCVEMNGK
jgi:hypothetical protein